MWYYCANVAATLLSIQNGFVSGQWDLLLLPIDKLPTDHLPLYNKVLITVRLTDHTHACRDGVFRVVSGKMALV